MGLCTAQRPGAEDPPSPKGCRLQRLRGTTACAEPLHSGLQQRKAAAPRAHAGRKTKACGVQGAGPTHRPAPSSPSPSWAAEMRQFESTSHLHPLFGPTTDAFKENRTRRKQARLGLRRSLNRPELSVPEGGIFTG